MNHLKFSLAALLLLSNLNAKEAEVELKEVTVSGEAGAENDPMQKKVGQSVKSAKELTKTQVSDNKDLVRYETGVTTVEAGRFGQSGYAIRGVEENRVAITVDGLHQAQTLSSQGFKELFEGYGNFNNTRNGVEFETLKQATISKGADSVRTGSGSLGGSVMFETKDARDLLLDKDYFYGYKGGYNTADNQTMHSHTLAGRFKWFDILAVQTKRRHHETENYGYKDYDDSVLGRTREKADPYYIKKTSSLIKLGFQPHEEHRFTFMSDTYKNRSQGKDLSYTLTLSSNRDEIIDTGLRYNDDMMDRKNRAFAYENFSETPLWDTMKFTYSNQKIKSRARTEEHCQAGENCAEISNPIGLQVKNNKVVDKYGGEVTLQRTQEVDPQYGGLTWVNRLVDSQGAVHDQNKFSINQNVSNTWLDCSVFDCSQPNIDVLKYDYATEQYIKSTVPLDKSYTDARTGKTFKQSSESGYLITPYGKGYLSRDWKERDLDTNTKQFNLDFNKYAKTGDVEHDIAYGLSFAKTEKSMTNKQGYDTTNNQWWAPKTLGTDFTGTPYTCENAPLMLLYALCPRTEPLTSFLIPVKTKEGALYLNDDMRVNDWLGINLGYRYDKIKYKPNYVPGSTPKIPDDMVLGLFVPYNPSPEPKWWDYADRDEWKIAHDAWKQEAPNNALANIKYIARDKKFTNSSYAIGADIDPLDYFRIQLKYSKGFRAPTSDELYLAFKHPDFTIQPNPDLKPEIAKTKELALTLHEDKSFITTSFFETKYDNFIDLISLGTKSYATGGGGNTIPFALYGNVNRSKATVRGFEINSMLHFGQISDSLKGFHASYKLTMQKGRVQTDNDGKVPMNAIQPTTAIYGLGYASPADKFGADIYVTNVASKKAKDTYNMFWRLDTDPYGNPYNTNSHSKWRSNAYTLVDVVTYVRPIKNLTFRLGVYNLTNEKYITWDAARSIRPFGTMNMIDRTTGLGINRFYSAGRNFRLNWEFTF